MAGEEHNAAQGDQRELTAEDTTSIFLPPLQDATTIEPKLSPDERAAVAALPAGSALLIAHTGPNTGARFLLDSDVTTAGRHPNADIFLDDVTVSRKHAEFHRTAEGFRLVDARSLNGTYVNNDRVDTLMLRNGNEVQIGKCRLTFYAARPAASREG